MYLQDVIKSTIIYFLSVKSVLKSIKSNVCLFSAIVNLIEGRLFLNNFFKFYDINLGCSKSSLLKRFILFLLYAENVDLHLKKHNKA